MGQIEIVGLGPGDLEQLPLGIYKKVTQTEKPVYVRTRSHPIVKELQGEGVALTAFDDVYEANDDFEEVYEKIVSNLKHQAKDQPIIYAVPGHPMLAERTVQLLREQTGTEVKITGGRSYLDDLFTALKIDPIDGFQFMDATEFSRSQINYRNHLIFSQIYDAFIASNVKLTLLEDLPADYQVTLVDAAGTLDETMRTISLEDLDRSFEVSNLTTLYVPPVPQALQSHTFARLCEIIASLRAPDGCPWDKEQTHESLREYAIEEVYELIEAVDEQDETAMVEELGDVLLQVMLHSQIGEEDGYFTIDDVIQALSEKMIYRHPHVFGGVHVDSAADVHKNWEALKEKEKTRVSIFDGIPKNSPALLKANKVQDRAENVDKADKQELRENIEKIVTLLRSVETSQSTIEDIIGRTLFALVRLSRYYKISPEMALARINNDFVKEMEGD